jgi:oxygen-independent coproporphyrinogen-3 oxidase
MNNNQVEKKPLGIYIHIPFCIHKCIYCDFVSAPANNQVKEDYVTALLKEIKQTYETGKMVIGGNIYDHYEVVSIFFGGGTPSCIDATLIGRIMDELRECFLISQDAEVSMECNPGTLTKEKAAYYRSIGINRLSFGLQSADNKELKMLGRIHTFEQFEDSFQIARNASFDNINIDIMSALPGQTLKSYQDTVLRTLACNPEHISAYSLILEEGTLLYDKIDTDYPPVPGEDEEREMYYLTEQLLAKHGYEHYEISNFAKPGFACRHNLAYWERKDYLGFGVSAASLFQECRYTNLSEVNAYIRKCEDLDSLRLEVHQLTIEEQMEEFMFLGLRKIDGINIKDFSYIFNKDIEDVYGGVIRKNIRLGLLRKTGHSISLTGHGIDVSNVVMSEFLLS